MKALHFALVKCVTENSIWFSNSTFHLNVLRHIICSIERTFLRFWYTRSRIPAQIIWNTKHWIRKKIFIFRLLHISDQGFATWFDNQKIESSLTLDSTTYFSKLFQKWFEECSKLTGFVIKASAPDLGNVEHCFYCQSFLLTVSDMNLVRKYTIICSCITCLKNRLPKRCITGRGATSIWGSVVPTDWEGFQRAW